MKSETLLMCLMLILTSCSGQSQVSRYAVRLSDLNGTWIEAGPSVTQGDVLRSPDVVSQQFSWGAGRSIPGTTYAFDLGRRKFWNVPGNLEDVRGVRKVGRSDLQVEIFDPGVLTPWESLQNGVFRIDPNKLNERALQQVIKQNTESFVAHFTDSDHMFIQDPNKSGVFGIIAGDRLELLRLSGPQHQSGGK